MSNNVPVKTILILAANPTNTAPLRLDQEIREIDEGLRQISEVVEAGQYKETRFDIESPENHQEGVDVIKLFATVDRRNLQLLELPALDQSWKGFSDQRPTNALKQLLPAVVDEDNPQRNIRVVTDSSEEGTTEKVELV